MWWAGGDTSQQCRDRLVPSRGRLIPVVLERDHSAFRAYEGHPVFSFPFDGVEAGMGNVGRKYLKRKMQSSLCNLLLESQVYRFAMRAYIHTCTLDEMCSCHNEVVVLSRD